MLLCRGRPVGMLGPAQGGDAMRWLLLGALLLSGCQAKDGEVLAKAGHRAGQKLGLTRGPSVNAFSGTLRGALGEMSLAVRVENRLRWDRFLADQPIEAVVTNSATVTLKGGVADLSLRQRAVELAKATLGVEGVIDEMTDPPE